MKHTILLLCLWTSIASAEELIRIDDVLEAHDLLRDYMGDVNGLFEKVSGR